MKIPAPENYDYELKSFLTCFISAFEQFSIGILYIHFVVFAIFNDW